MNGKMLRMRKVKTEEERKEAQSRALTNPQVCKRIWEKRDRDNSKKKHRNDHGSSARHSHGAKFHIRINLLQILKSQLEKKKKEKKNKWQLWKMNTIVCAS